MRRVFRIIGWLFVFAGAVLLVHDGVGWLIDGGTFRFTDTGLLWFRLHPASLQVAEPAVARYIHPVLWHPVITSLLLTPAFVVFGVFGIVLLILTRIHERPKSSHLFIG